MIQIVYTNLFAIGLFSISLHGGAFVAEPLLTSSAPIEEQDGRDQAKTAIALDPISFNLIRNGRVEGDISVEMVMELKEASDFEEIKARQPLIQSDFLQALAILAKARFRLNRPIDPDLVIAFLQPVANKRLGPGKVTLFVRHAVITPAIRR